MLLIIDHIPPEDVAIYGPLKTENIGVEKIVANVISNPYIRYLAVCGEDIRGHRAGSSLVALHKNGIDKQHRIIDAPGAIPYIENIDEKAIERFRKQVEVVNLIGVTDKKKIDSIIKEYTSKHPLPFGEPYVAIKIKPEIDSKMDDKRALHSKIVVDYMGKIEKRSI